jgi:hypothetical protein
MASTFSPNWTRGTGRAIFIRAPLFADSIMKYSPQQAALIVAELQKTMQAGPADDSKIKQLTWLLLNLHRVNLTQDLRGWFGEQVYAGPFKGMRLTPAVLTANYTPHLLGAYEHELHPALERAIAENYRQILNIGCAFGYYSIGLAQRMPDTAVHAFDIDETARGQCRDMAALNEVSDRVTVGGEFRGEDFASYAGKKTLIVMDIEGAEQDLLDPTRTPALGGMDAIVELHECYIPGIAKTVCDRFTATHDIELVRNHPSLFAFDRVFGPGVHIDAFDNFVATWETRPGPTPWAVMRAKTRS